MRTHTFLSHDNKLQAHLPESEISRIVVVLQAAPEAVIGALVHVSGAFDTKEEIAFLNGFFIFSASYLT